jgi:hypothetical protein
VRAQVNQFNLVAWRSCSGWPVLRPNATAKAQFACADRLTHYAQTQGVVQGYPSRMSAFFMGPLVPADAADNAGWVVQKVAQHPSADTLRTLVLGNIDTVVGHFSQVCSGETTNPFADYAGIGMHGMVVAADGVSADGSLKPAGTQAGSQNVWASAWPVTAAAAAGVAGLAAVPGWMGEPYARARKAWGVPSASGMPSLLYADTGLGSAGPKATAVLGLLKAARAADASASPDGVLFRLTASECADSSALALAIGFFGEANFPVWLAVDETVPGFSYGGVAAACVKAAASCKAILFAGFTDNYCPDGQNTTNCMLDGNFVAKPQFAALQAALGAPTRD